MAENRSSGFPVTIVRPPTFTMKGYALAIGGDTEFWQVICRMRQENRVIVPGDGTSLWTLTHNRTSPRALSG
ncbi:MAG: hypothetical protein ACLRXC_02655 [[Clostridium] leptum]